MASDRFPTLVAQEWGEWARPALTPYDGWRIVAQRNDEGTPWVEGRPVVVLALSSEDGTRTIRVRVDFGRQRADHLEEEAF